jgi:hypothetical protein
VAGAPRQWLIVVDVDAVLDLEDVKNRGERRALFNALDKLRILGPDLPSPHMKSLKGETDLFELRPRQGNSPLRPIYARRGDRFVVLAIAAKKSGFDSAVADAKARLPRHD